jgi:hypothetical protein
MMKINPLWSICLITRICIALIVGYYRKIDKIMLIVLSIIGLGFLYKGYTGSNDEIQIAPVFWHDTRYVHGVLYLLAASYLFVGNPIIALSILLSDVIFSIVYRIITSQ